MPPSLTRLPRRDFLRIAAAVSAAAAMPARAADLAREAPIVGQEGKDVLWVPTPETLVDRMLALARVTPRDLVVDLGSGDGRIPIAAAKQFGARAIGIEYDAEMVKHAARRAIEAGVGNKVEMRQGDIFEADFSQATVVAVYLLTALNVRLRPTILAMKPGTRVVAHQFGFGDEWEPDDVIVEGERRAMLWIVPARIGGTWRVTTNAKQTPEAELSLRQTYQRVQGEITRSRTERLRAPRLRGDRLTFALDDGAGERLYYARIDPEGRTMRGVSTDGQSTARWQATRT